MKRTPHAAALVGPPRTDLAKAWTILVCAAMGLATLCAFVPLAPRMPSGGLDGSWMLAMNQAVAEHLPIGRAVVFTFGPYASIYTAVYHPDTDRLMLFGSAYLAIAYATCLASIARRAPPAFPLLVLLVLCGVRFPRDTLLFSYPLFVVIACLDLTRPRDLARRERLVTGLATAVVFGGLGLLPLVKGTQLVVCVPVIVSCAVVLTVSRRVGLAAIAVGSPVVAGTVFWLAAGQSFSDLPRYFASIVPIASGYTEAMSVSGTDPGEIWVYLVAATLLALAASRMNAWSRIQRVHLGFSVALLLFVAFKSGYVRHDGHVLIASSFLLFVAIALLAVGRSTWMIAGFVASLGAWQYVDEHYYATRPPDLVAQARSLFGDAWNGAVRRWNDRSGLESDYRATIRGLARTNPIPLLDGTVDLYPHDLADLIASGNRWTPRPVFQSYSAYTAGLATGNAEFLSGPAAPDHVVFGIQSIDGRVPALDDGASWPVLLGRYRPVDARAGRLYLDKLAAGQAAPLSASVPAERHRLGEFVRVPPSAGPVYANLDIRPSLWGHLVGFFFKPGQLWITLHLEDGSSREFRLISDTARSGFVLSPLVEDGNEFALLYGAVAALDGKRVESFAVDGKGGSAVHWKPEYEVRFRNVSGIARADVGAILDVDRFDDAVRSDALQAPAPCDGSIDRINGAPLSPTLTANGFLRLDGWLAASAADGRLADETFIVFTDVEGHERFVRTHPVSRVDVATFFRRATLERAGYSTFVELAGMRGQYRVALAHRTDGVVHRCTQFDIPLTVRGD